MPAVGINNSPRQVIP